MRAGTSHHEAKARGVRPHQGGSVSRVGLLARLVIHQIARLMITTATMGYQTPLEMTAALPVAVRAIQVAHRAMRWARGVHAAIKMVARV